jgi:hypothetical protein
VGCKACAHPYERHLFGGACFYCDCKRAVYDTSPVGLRTQKNGEPGERSDNGATPPTTRPRRRRLGSK